MPSSLSRLPKYDFGAHFLTARTFRRHPYFADARCARIFCEELEFARKRYGFFVLAFVLMPDHVHLLLWWDAEMAPKLTISKIAWAVKGRSARRMVKMLQRESGAGIQGVGEMNFERVDEGSAIVYPLINAAALLTPARRPRNAPHYRNWRYAIWQKGAGYDFNVYTERKLMAKICYIHANPVRAGLSATAEGYPWSSAANYAGLPARHPVAVSVGFPAGK